MPRFAAFSCGVKQLYGLIEGIINILDPELVGGDGGTVTRILMSLLPERPLMISSPEFSYCWPPVILSRRSLGH
ncbi:hypothetical protein H2508_10310 [Parahaliea sp. F7430]|uniref:Uncharacterized protein n=1 Tax=Sediminihaliea albiluteola TaxID=2758564 RepID=A0A7W2TX28_9GAMM|nr:hypothetical protein [Sediminihaliea albiluteola]MBA6413501.1 hypothetical protein [Sediminihaliea albiluteola]